VRDSPSVQQKSRLPCKLHAPFYLSQGKKYS
jgi:hypothetical protein